LPDGEDFKRCRSSEGQGQMSPRAYCGHEGRVVRDGQMGRRREKSVDHSKLSGRVGLELESEEEMRLEK
jgi:hypothetical protein